jgi:eukaryotic-like serine/threonine-protein kinase
MGTAQYLSPEQAQGRAVDARSDLYSIGIVLYELLTGQVPFDADSPVTVALKQVSEMPVPPAEIVPSIPPAIDAVVLHALEKDPDRRWQNADEFIAALETAIAEPQRIPPPPPPPVVEEERRSRWWLWVLIALALIAIAVGLYLTLRPEQLTVPDVIDRESATASQILQNRGFEVDIVTVVNPDVERDHVAAQDPRPNTEAPEGSTVTITVSAGPGDAAVPSVAGMAQDEAEKALEDAGFKTRVERVFSADVKNGNVVATSPPAGTTLERGSEVSLQVSKGAEQVEVPDVTGESQDNARSALEGAGLRVGKITREESGEAPGTVIEQSPAAGEKLDKGEAVDLTVAEATEIPDVVDLTEEEAQADLEDAGFEVSVRDQAITDPADEGIVLDQSPAAGEERRQGSRVTIVVGRATPESTPTPSPTTAP